MVFDFKRAVFLPCLLACYLGVGCLAQQPGDSARLAVPDEAALRRVANEFFAAYARKDVAGWEQLWSRQSTDLKTSSAEFQTFIARRKQIELKTIGIGRISLDGSRAELHVSVELQSTPANEAQPVPERQRLNRILRCVEEDGDWKVISVAIAERELATRLADAKTEPDREATLASARELWTADLWQSVHLLAQRNYAQGQLTEALRLFELARRCAEISGDQSGIAQSLNAAGVAYGELGNYEAAVSVLRQSLELAERLNQQVGMAYVMTHLASTLLAQGQYDDAFEYFHRSIAIQEKLPDKQGLSSTLHNLGIAYYSIGDYRQALESYQRSLSLYPEKEDSDVGNTLNNIGNVYRLQREYELALEQHRRALAIYEKYPNKRRIAVALNNLGTDYQSLKKNDLALESFERSLELREPDDLRGRAAVWNNICSLNFNRGDYDKAEAACRQSLKFCEASKYDEAASESHNNLAEIYHARQEYAQALAEVEQAVALARKRNSPDLLWPTRTLEGRIRLAMGQRGAARAAFEESIAIIEDQRQRVAGSESAQESFFEDKLEPYQRVLGLLAAERQSAAALAYSENAKARVLLDVLRGGRGNVTKAMTEAERGEEKRLSARLASLNAQLRIAQGRSGSDSTKLPAGLNALQEQLKQTRMEQDGFLSRLYVAHPDLKTQRGLSLGFKLEQASSLLPDTQTALLEYAITEDKSYLFAIVLSDGVPHLTIYELPVKQKELSELAMDFRSRVASRNLLLAEQASRLYQLLLKPAQDQLKDKTRLIIVPDGVLWELPFQALRDSAGRYLIEDFSISYAPSLAALAEMVKASRQREGRAGSLALLAFGDPTNAQGNVRSSPQRATAQARSLPDTELEVRELQRLYGAGNSKVFTGTAAREEAFKQEAGSFRILHLATHSILDDASPLYSQIVLASPPPTLAKQEVREDGVLEAWEILKLDLRAELAVLSACETARGRLGAGEGIIGLSWALFVAGVPSTVVSQWKVDAASTSELMREFHRQLRTRNQNSELLQAKSDSLRAAELKLLHGKRYSHPFYWASFVIVGDGY